MKIFTKAFISVFSVLFLLTGLPFTPGFADGNRKILVSDTDELILALENVRAGDEIILKEGVYQNDKWLGEWAAFYAKADGTPDNHIILRSEDSENPAIISGVTQENKVALKIIGSYWEIRDLKVCEASKGIFLQQSEHSVISNCEVYNIGSEAIHIIDNSSYNLVENCYVHDAGTVVAKYGEGIYVGSAKNAEDYGFDCHYNTIRGCRLGPNIAADHVDIKEFTIGTIVENCTFDGTGMKNENGGNSFVEIKGNNAIIRNNTGYRNGCENQLYGFDLNVQIDGWGQNNKIYDNTLYLDTDECYIVKEWNCSTEVFRNTAYPETATYSGNKTLQVTGFEYSGDINEDGIIDFTDLQTLQNFIMQREVKHISNSNSDLVNDNNLDIFDICALRKRITENELNYKPRIHVSYNKEDAGKWRMTNGLGGRELTFVLAAEPEHKLNLGWGYWDPNLINDETGKSGKWVQISLGQHTLDENGETSITVELPEAVTSVALQVYDYLDGSEKLNKDEVQLAKVFTE